MDTYEPYVIREVQKVLENDAPEEMYHNRFLAAAMVELKMVDTIGSGIKKMFGFQRQRLFPMPDYSLSRKDVDNLLIRKLPDALDEKQKMNKIGNLLTQLRVAQKICVGKKKRWVLK